MGNPNPVQTIEFKERQYKAQGEIPGNQPLSKRAMGVKLPIDVDAVIRALPDEERAAWLRKVICDAVHAELMQTQD